MRVWSTFAEERITAVGPFMSVPGKGEVTPSASGSPFMRPSGKASHTRPKGTGVEMASIDGSYGSPR